MAQMAATAIATTLMTLLWLCVMRKRETAVKAALAAGWRRIDVTLLFTAVGSSDSSIATYHCSKHFISKAD